MLDNRVRVEVLVSCKEVPELVRVIILWRQMLRRGARVKDMHGYKMPKRG